MFDDLTKSELYAILAGVFTASLIISNIIAGKTFEFFSFTLPCGVIIFPLIYMKGYSFRFFHESDCRNLL